jgi:hypothetical protein
MNTKNLRWEVASYNISPDYWAVYAIEHPTLGFFAGFKPFDESPKIPMWCKKLEGAKLYDAYRDISSRVIALDLCRHYFPEAKVWMFRRHEIFPEYYTKKVR